MPIIRQMSNIILFPEISMGYITLIREGFFNAVIGKVNVQGIKVPEFEVENELLSGIGQKPERDSLDE